MGAFLRRHVLAVSVLAILAVGGAVFVAVWFQPQKLVIDKTVRETLPPGAPPASATPPHPTGGAQPGSGTVLARATFGSRAHHASGTVRVIELPSGKRVVRLEDLDVENGPDLFVTLAEATAGAPNAAFDDNYVSLGRLKGNKGDQTYDVPTGLDLSRYASVAIWCKRFSTVFGTASLR